MNLNDLLTRQDLEDFKTELFELLKPLIDGQPSAARKWLKNEDVRKLLKVSNATVQNLRVSGTLPFSKIGGIYYYKQEDIDKMLDNPEKKSSGRKK